jgi:hypothetical protein
MLCEVVVPNFLCQSQTVVDMLHHPTSWMLAGLNNTSSPTIRFSTTIESCMFPTGLHTVHSYFCEHFCAQTCSVDTYRKVQRRINISFAFLGNEECDDCTDHKHHVPTCTDELCPECKAYHELQVTALHSSSHACTGSLANRDWEEGELVVSADLMKAFLIPVMLNHAAVFCRRMIVYTTKCLLYLSLRWDTNRSGLLTSIGVRLQCCGTKLCLAAKDRYLQHLLGFSDGQQGQAVHHNYGRQLWWSEQAVVPLHNTAACRQLTRNSNEHHHHCVSGGWSHL